MSIESIATNGWSAEARPMRMRLARQVATGMIKEQDSDGNGSLAPNETGLSAQAFAGMDGDADGQVTQQEITNGLHERNARLRQLLSDANGDARLGQAKATRVAERALAGLDGDSSASLGLDESGLSAEGFSRVDGNADGLLTAPEIANAIRDRRSEANDMLQRVAGAASSDDGKGDVIAGTQGVASMQNGPTTTGEAIPVASAQQESEAPTPEREQSTEATGQPRMRQGLSAYAGHMGELMTQLFGPPPMTGTDMQEGANVPASAAKTISVSV